MDDDQTVEMVINTTAGSFISNQPTDPPQHWRVNGTVRPSLRISLVSVGKRVGKNYHVFSILQRCLTAVILLGTLVLSCLNLAVWRIPKVLEVVDPLFPKMGWVPFLVVGLIVAYVGCQTDVTDKADSPDSSPRRLASPRRPGAVCWDTSQTLDISYLRSLDRKSACQVVIAYLKGVLQTVQAGGCNFHRKVFILQLVKMLNMAVALKANLVTGQAKRWIIIQATLILINSIVVPILLFKGDPKYHTLGLIMWDLGVDTLYGALLPLCMIANVTAHTATHLSSLLRMKTPTAAQTRILAVVNRYVPRERWDIVHALVPYITFILRMADVKKARFLQKIQALPEYCDSPFLQRHHNVVRASFTVFGFTLFVATLWRLFAFAGCAESRTIPWGAACLHETYFTFQSCRCIYFHYGGKISKGHFKNHFLTTSEVSHMLNESADSLMILSYWNYTGTSFPSLERNPSIQWLFLEGGGLEELPSLSKNQNLDRLVVREQQLRALPDISHLWQLKWLDVQSNRLSKIPKLNKNTLLERILVSGNNLEELPSTMELACLTKIRAAHNQLRHLEKLSGNINLRVLDLTDNRLKELPGLEANVNLVELGLSNNYLSDLPDLRYNSKLTWLEAANNQLYQLAGLDGNRKIWYLNVSGNKLKRLPPLDFDNLTIVDVCRNQFKDWPVPLTGENVSTWDCRCCRRPWFHR